MASRGGAGNAGPAPDQAATSPIWWSTGAAGGPQHAGPAPFALSTVISRHHSTDRAANRASAVLAVVVLRVFVVVGTLTGPLGRLSATRLAVVPAAGGSGAGLPPAVRQREADLRRERRVVGAEVGEEGVPARSCHDAASLLGRALGCFDVLVAPADHTAVGIVRLAVQVNRVGGTVLEGDRNALGVLAPASRWNRCPPPYGGWLGRRRPDTVVRRSRPAGRLQPHRPLLGRLAAGQLLIRDPCHLRPVTSGRLLSPLAAGRGPQVGPRGVRHAPTNRRPHRALRARMGTPRPTGAVAAVAAQSELSATAVRTGCHHRCWRPSPIWPPFISW